jgi:hypothetical protein
MSKSACLGLALVLALAAGANGAFMLISPGGWYDAVPGVTTTGPFNQHFIRDIGLIFLLLGLALLAGVGRPPVRTLLWTGAAVWLCGHALFHLWEVAVGICSASALVRDFPAVSLPAILTGLLAYWSGREDRRAGRPLLSPRPRPAEAAPRRQGP